MLALKELGLHFADSQSVSLVRKLKKEALVDGFFTRNESPANEMLLYGEDAMHDECNTNFARMHEANNVFA